MSCRPFLLLVILFLMAPVTITAQVRSGPPIELGRTVITWNEISDQFLGTFVLPMAQENDDRFGYSEAIHTQLASGNLIVSGHIHYSNQAEIQLPQHFDGSDATRVGPWVDYTQGLLPDGWGGGPAYRVGGMLELDGRIYFTKFQWYNGAGTDWQTQGFYQGPYDGSGVATGMFGVNGVYAHHSRVGGYISPAPRRVHNDGYEYLAGLQGTSGAAHGRWGPNLFAIDFQPINGNVSSVPLICHDSQSNQVPGWWIANIVTSGIWIETWRHHGVLFFVVEGLGEKWYGPANNGKLIDPYGGGNGYHAEGWKLSAWIYDPDDLMEVYEGSRDPWSLLPIETVELIRRDPGSATETYLSFFTGSAKSEMKMSLHNGRFIILQPNGHQASTYERTPKGYVFDIDSAKPSN